MEGITWQVIQSNRKSIGLEIRDGQLLVRAPRSATRQQIEEVIRQHGSWVARHLKDAREQQSRLSGIQPLTREETEALAKKALAYIPQRAAYYAGLIGVRYHRITIRNQRTRWGSCSSQGNLNFNCLLMLTPPEVIDCIVVHELCHLKEMNHSDRFYREVLRVCPDYFKWHGWLKAHQAELMARLG